MGAYFPKVIIVIPSTFYYIRTLDPSGLGWGGWVKITRSSS